MSDRSDRSSRRRLAFVLLLPILLALLPFLVARGATAPASVTPSPPEVLKWGFISAALASGLSAIGASIAVAVVGGAAMGAVAEKPETAGRALLFVGLAEGIAIYGLIIAIMILGRLT